MRVCIAPKIALRVSAVLMLSASMASALAASRRQVSNDQPLSPRLATLQERLKSGDRKALDSFWKDISERGAPMIEAAPSNDRDVLVTILWRATEETKNVFVFRIGDVNRPMTRLLDTDLWYKTFQFQKGARFMYQLGTNLPDPKEWGGVTRFAEVLQNDRLNPLQYSERSNEFNPYEVRSFSAVELPSAEPQLWNVPRPTVPAGRVQRDKFASKLLGNERSIWIYTPHGYAADKKPYGLLVLTDGFGYLNSARVATILDNLIAGGLIPPLVAVMVDNPDRFRELACNAKYADFLAQEIVPWARANYHATARPEQTIIGGASLGGLQAAFVGLKHPQVFGNVLSQSGSFQWKPDDEKEWEWLKGQFAASPRLPLRFSIEAGLLEGTWWWRSLVPVSANGTRAADPTLLAANRNFKEMLQSKGYSVNYTEFNGNHGFLNWRGTLASHLIALVGIKPAPKISQRDKARTVLISTPKQAVSQVKVAPTVMRQYVGRYELDPKFTNDFVLYVSVNE